MIGGCDLGLSCYIEGSSNSIICTDSDADTDYLTPTLYNIAHLIQGASCKSQVRQLTCNNLITCAMPWRSELHLSSLQSALPWTLHQLWHQDTGETQHPPAASFRHYGDAVVTTSSRCILAYSLRQQGMSLPPATASSSLQDLHVSEVGRQGVPLLNAPNWVAPRVT
jgi:hypothetical protein